MLYCDGQIDGQNGRLPPLVHIVMSYKNAGRKQKKIKTFVRAGKNEYFCG